jgi:hypothetical protein
VADAMSEPKMLKSDPGATFGVKLAALTTPPAAMVGGAFKSA